MNKKNITILVVILVAIVATGAYFFYTKEEVTAPASEYLNTETVVVGFSGLTVAEAEAKADADGVMFRVVERDGELQPTTRDFQEGRINATVRNDVVIEYTIETMSPVLEDNPVEESSNHDSIIGMTKTEAEAYVAANDVDFRIVSIDGEALPATLDYRPGRISAETVDGIVVRYTTE